MPFGSGILPGPRQDAFGIPYHSYNESTFHTASVTFEASRTYLETFLPTSDFTIATAGNIARATLYATRLGKLEWLGGRDYNIFGLYIHNVQVRRDSVDKSAEPVTGRFLPILFESLADPILSGREELGFSKIFADIDIQLNDNEFQLQAGWGGVKFADFTLKELQLEKDTSQIVFATGPLRKSLSGISEQGVLHYKYVPTTGEPGKADAAYPTFTPNPTPENKGIKSRVHKRLIASPENVKVHFKKRQPRELPTLWNVVESLRNLEILSVIGAQVAIGTGVGDVVQQVKL